MKLSMRSIGGFAGPAAPEVRQLDVEGLAPALAQSLKAQIDATQFFELPAKILKDAPKSWDFLHELTIEDDASGRRHCVQFHTDAASGELNALLETIRQIAP